MANEKIDRYLNNPRYKEAILTARKNKLTKAETHKIIGHSVPYEIIDKYWQEAKQSEK